MGFEADIEVSLVVPTRLFDTPSHASSLTAKMRVVVNTFTTKRPLCGPEESIAWRSKAIGFLLVGFGGQWEKRHSVCQGAGSRELGFFVTVAVAIGLFATGKLGLEITSSLAYIHSKASLCQRLSQAAALQFHEAAFTTLPCLVRKTAGSHSSAKTCLLFSPLNPPVHLPL